MTTRPKKCFRMLFPKSSSNLSTWLRSSLSNFESSLTERMKKLIPQNKHEILTLPWMSLAIESICETHNDINILINDLKLHNMIDLEHQCWINVYMDITARSLDFCHTFTSELNRINHCIFGIKILRNDLDSTSEEQCIEIGSTLDYWRQNITAKNPQCSLILGGLVESLNFPKVKNSPNSKVFMKAFYATSVLTVYICNVFVTLLSNSDKDLSHISVSKQTLWKKAFLDMQTIVNSELRDVISSHGTMVLKELECVDAKVKEMHLMIQESLKESMVELKEEVEKLDHGLDELSRNINNLFSVIVKGRNTIGL